MLFKNYDQLIANGYTPELKQKRQDILEILTAAINAVDPYTAVHTHFFQNTIHIENTIIDTEEYKKIYLIGFGKASIPMTQAVIDKLSIEKGIIITNTAPQTWSHQQVEIIIGGHPLPNDQSIIGTKKIISLLEQTTTDDLLIILISGGGSALLCHPRVNLKNMQHTTELLLHSGATITEINTIRKHLSHVKGGQLLRYTPARCISFIISDVVGDPVEFIASGPSIADTTTYTDAKTILQHHNLWNKIPISVQKIISAGIAGKIPETVKSNDSLLLRCTNSIVANNYIACRTAQQKAQKLGYTTHLETTTLTGEARLVGKQLIKYLQDRPQNSGIITGGETTVTLKGSGRGGRNQELMLGLIPLLTHTDIVAASFATDGIDGTSDAAGAIGDPYTHQRALQNKLYSTQFLKNNDSYNFFRLLKDGLITYATGTNVMDIQVLLK